MSDLGIDLARTLEACFRRILRERMEGVPIVNERLQVEWIPGCTDGDADLGVLVTPWFISLIRLPQPDTDWHKLAPGDVVRRQYPAGRYAFMVNEEPGLGLYQSCSLFSPVLEFDSHLTAVETARYALAALFDEQHAETADVDEQTIVDRWHPKVEDAPDTQVTGGDTTAAEHEELRTLEAGNRRAFLTGSVRGGAST